MQNKMALFFRRAGLSVLLLTAFVMMGEIGSSSAEMCDKRSRHSTCWYYPRAAFIDHPCEWFQKPFCPTTDFYPVLSAGPRFDVGRLFLASFPIGLSVVCCVSPPARVF